MEKIIKCEQTNLLVTKEKYLSCYKVGLYFNDLHFNNFTLYFSFWSSTVNICFKSENKYLIYYKLGLNVNNLHFNGFTLHFSFWISTVNKSH